MKNIECPCAPALKHIARLGKKVLDFIDVQQQRHLDAIISDHQSTRLAFTLRVETLVETVDPDMQEWHHVLPAAVRLGLIGQQIIDGTIDKTSAQSEVAGIMPNMPMPVDEVCRNNLHPTLVTALQPYLDEAVPPAGAV